MSNIQNKAQHGLHAHTGHNDEQSDRIGYSY